MRRKGIPCGQDCCSPSKHCVKAINNVSPDPNGDLTLRAGNGIAISQTGDDEITITNSANPNSFIAGSNIELNPSGDDISIDLTAEPVVDGLTVNGDAAVTGNNQISGNLEVNGTSKLNDDLEVNGDSQLNGDLEVNGDIIQKGVAYETHAQQIYTVDDYIIMRDGAISALSAGDYSGFQVKKYDGTNDGRLVIDSSGTARVGDVGDEQPLLTRSESAQLNNGDLLQWNGTSQKAVSSGVNTSQIVRGTGNIGSDLKPIKIVNGVATAVTNDLVDVSTGGQVITGFKVFNQGDNSALFIMNPNISVFSRPSTYRFTEINFTGASNEAYITLRATMDAQGSRRLEVNLRDVYGNNHWTVLASRQD